MPHRRLPAVFRVASSPLQAPRRFRNPENRPGRVSIPNSSPFSRSTRFPFTSTPSPPTPLAIRKAPSASVESIQPRPPQPCEVGRPKGRRRKNRRQSHRFFLAPAAPGTPTRRHALGRLPTPPPPPENLLSDCTENCPLRPLRAPRRFRNPKIGQQLGAQPTPRFRVMIEALLDALLDAVLDAVIDPWPPFTFCCPQAIVDEEAGVSIPNSSPFSRSTRLPFTSTPSPPAPLAIRKAPSASVESIEPRPPRPCEVGRPKVRRRKNRRQSHRFFFKIGRAFRESNLRCGVGGFSA